MVINGLAQLLIVLTTKKGSAKADLSARAAQCRQ